MSLMAALGEKALESIPLKWIALAVVGVLTLTAGYLCVRWQLAEAEIVRLDARISLMATERDIARTDQDALRRACAALRAQLEEAQHDFAAYAAESVADRQRLSHATQQPATPGKVVDDATSAWALDRFDALLRR